MNMNFRDLFLQMKKKSWVTRSERERLRVMMDCKSPPYRKFDGFIFNYVSTFNSIYAFVFFGEIEESFSWILGE